MKKYIAEFVGTFLFTLVVALSIGGHFAIATPLLAAITLGILVYLIGHISGAHLNPVQTIGIWSLKKISTNDAIGYIVAQFLGAGLTYFFARQLTLVPTLAVANNWAVWLAEIVGAAIFMFAIPGLVYNRVPTDASGAVVGGSLLIGLSVAAAIGSNAVLNPAMALAIGSFSWAYVFGPIVGAVVGMRLYKLVSE